MLLKCTSVRLLNQLERLTNHLGVCYLVGKAVLVILFDCVGMPDQRFLVVTLLQLGLG